MTPNVGEDTEQRWQNMNHEPNSVSCLFLINEVLLENSHVHLFIYFIWLLLHCDSRTE